MRTFGRWFVALAVVVFGTAAVLCAAADDNPGNLRYTGSGPHYLTSGKLGVGTTVPLERLHVAGGLRVGQGTTQDTFLQGGLTQTATVIPVNSTAGFPPLGTLVIRGNPGTEEVVFYMGINGNSFTGVLRGRLGTTVRAHGFSERVHGLLLMVTTNETKPRLIVDDFGFVGVGTVVPQSQVEIQNDPAHYGSRLAVTEVHTQTSVALEAIAEGSSGIARVITLSAHPLAFAIGTGEQMRILPNGNVGVGTTAPNSLLEVDGSGYLQFSHAVSGRPPATDCDSDEERGRLSIDTLNRRLYICMGASRGWDYAPLYD